MKRGTRWVLVAAFAVLVVSVFVAVSAAASRLESKDRTQHVLRWSGPEFGAVETVPSKPVAGKRFVFTMAVFRGDTGDPLRTGTMVCVPTVAGKLLPHTESFTNGVARVAFVVPKSAKGKQLKLKVEITFGGASATEVATFKVR